MERAQGRLAGAQAGRMLRAGEMRRLIVAIGLTVAVLLGAGARVIDQVEEGALVAEICAEIDANSQLMNAVLTWLMAEDAAPVLPHPALEPVAARAMEAAGRMMARHERAMQLAWRDGRGGELIAIEPSDFEEPVHRIDLLMRNFLRGVARAAEAQGHARAAARADLRVLTQTEVAPGLEEVHRLLTLDMTAARRQVTIACILGAAGAALCLGAILMLHVCGPRRSNEALEAKVDTARDQVRAAELSLRGAERDRARAMEQSAVGLARPSERVRAAAALLARTPLSGTQERVLQGLRAALAELIWRLDGMRVLAAAGDARLRLTLREMDPAALYAAWIAEAAAQAGAQGREIAAPPELIGAGLVRGDELMIRRALDRLLDDSLRRTPKGGKIEISAAFETLGRVWPELQVTVLHDGPPPGPSELASIRAPFASRPPAYSAASVSNDPFALSVVAAICAAGGGSLQIAPRVEGGMRIDAKLLFAPLGGKFDDQVDAMASGASPRARDYAKWLDETAAISAVCAEPVADVSVADVARPARERRVHPRGALPVASGAADQDRRDTT